jgi:hypothetical protein
MMPIDSNMKHITTAVIDSPIEQCNFLEFALQRMMRIVDFMKTKQLCSNIPVTGKYFPHRDDQPSDRPTGGRPV